MPKTRHKSPQRRVKVEKMINFTHEHSKPVTMRLERAAKLTFVAIAAIAASACATSQTGPGNSLLNQASGEIAKHIQATGDAGTTLTPTTAFRRGQIVVVQPTAMPGPRILSARTAPVRVSRTFPASRYNPAQVAVGQKLPTQAPDQLSRWVLVSGNFTPKGIYSRPSSSSRILMRVAPGARLRLERSIDGWHKVETDRGVGYLQAHDAKLLATAPGAKPRVIKPKGFPASS